MGRTHRRATHSPAAAFDPGEAAESISTRFLRVGWLNNSGRQKTIRGGYQKTGAGNSRRVSGKLLMRNNPAKRSSCRDRT